jgi:hypothetical protein
MYAPGAGTSTGTHSESVTDNSLLGWQSVYVIVNSGDEAIVSYRGVEWTFVPSSTKDFIGSQIGDFIIKSGINNSNGDDIAHVSIHNYALTPTERTNVATNTPDNLGGSLPMIYQRLDADADDGIGQAWVNNDGGNPVTFDSGENPSLVGPTPTNPVHTDGPNATSLTEFGATITGTVSDACTVAILQTANGTPQPSDASFDASTDTQFVGDGASYSIPTDDGVASTPYTWWSRLEPNLGTNSYASVNATTTPPAPTITLVNGGNPINNLGSFSVTGSGFTGHTSADIDGVAQAGFTVDNDNQVTMTAVRPNALAYGATAVLNVGGTTVNVTMEPQTGWDRVNIVSLAPEGVIDTTPPLEVGDQVAWEVVNGSAVLDNGTASATTVPATFDSEVHDTSSWGAVGQITIEAVMDSISTIGATGDYPTISAWWTAVKNVDDGNRQVGQIIDSGTIVGNFVFDGTAPNGALLTAEASIYYDHAAPTDPHVKITSATGVTCDVQTLTLFEFEGIEIESTGLLATYNPIQIGSVNASKAKVKDCAIVGGYYGFRSVVNASATGTLENTLVKDTQGDGIWSNTATTTVTNCAIIDCNTSGLLVSGGYNGIIGASVVNTVAFNNGYRDFLDAVSTATNVASGDLTAYGTDPVTGVVAGDFQNAAAGIYLAADSGALDGTGLGGEDIGLLAVTPPPPVGGGGGTGSTVNPSVEPIVFNIVEPTVRK